MEYFTYLSHFIEITRNIEYYNSILSQGNTDERRITHMNNAELVWRLVELLLKKEEDKMQVALAQDQTQNDTKRQDDEVHKKV